jgi:SAM-dependent methyltransferase
MIASPQVRPASTITLADYRTLWRLSQERLRSEQDYRAFQAFQAALLIRYLETGGVTLPGQWVLDLGSGIGGYSEELARRGAHVVSLDLMSAAVRLSAKCLPVAGNAQRIPLADASIDFVFCASLIEHVSDPAALLAEIWRVLRPGGYAYVSFPPFYSPLGGHEYAPFHYLGEAWAMRLSAARRQRSHPAWARQLYNVAETPTSFANSYDDWGLYRMTIAKARRLVRTAGFVQVDLSTRYLPFSPVRWPVIGEVLTWHAQFLLRKP